MSKKSWIVTHGRGGGFLTYDLFKAEPAEFHLSSIDECHYTTDEVVVYTYLHFKQYVSKTTLTAFMDKMKLNAGMVRFEIFGYSSIATFGSGNGESIKDHVGLKILADHYMNHNPAFRSCTDGKPGVKRGMLWYQDSITRLKDLVGIRNKRLIPFLEQILEKQGHDEASSHAGVSKIDDKKVLSEIAWDAHPALVEPLFDAGMRAMIVEYNQMDRAMMKAASAHERTIKAAQGEIGPYSKGKPGEIYAATCVIWMHLYKIGFTCMGAEQRVKQLQTAGLMEPFELVRAVRVPDARLYEKAVHLYFKQVRVYKRKEFFAVERDEVHRLFDQIEGVVARTPKEQQWWEWAYAAASKRLERKLLA